jgi:hypothetical protein
MIRGLGRGIVVLVTENIKRMLSIKCGLSRARYWIEL